MITMNKRKLFILLLIILLIALGLFWFWQKRGEIKKETEGSITDTMSVSGRIVLPQGIPSDSFQVVSLGEVVAPDSKGNFSNEIYQDGVTAVTALPKDDKGHELIKIVVSSDSKPDDALVLDLKSTAVAVVFETPFFFTNDPDGARELLKAIESDPKVEGFSKVIESVLTNENYLEDPLYRKAFKEAVESVLNTLNP